jgi:GGDEF domain-containing protein
MVLQSTKPVKCIFHWLPLVSETSTKGYLDIRIENFDGFRNRYGFVAGDDVLRFCRRVILEVIEHSGSDSDFIGHPSSANFVIITRTLYAQGIKNELKRRFNHEIRTHYNFEDLQRGYISINPSANQSEIRVPLMHLAIGLISTDTHWFSDIREITEMAAEDRRRDASLATS